ncbi:hypothetical protein RNJ44_02046 [Nakaseomyces bracarensis]|uniref:Uncharacterized protein n=1 Tax=Nakaseomyces bracarensis TaxID=273131 RepID=A0ABR4NMH2_9SACH
MANSNSTTRSYLADTLRNKSKGIQRLWKLVFRKREAYYYPNDDPEAVIGTGTTGLGSKLYSSSKSFATTVRDKCASVKQINGGLLSDSMRTYFRKRHVKGASASHGENIICSKSLGLPENTSKNINSDFDISYLDTTASVLLPDLERQGPPFSDNYDSDRSLIDFSFNTRDDTTSLKAIYNSAKETENYLVSGDIYPIFTNNGIRQYQKDDIYENGEPNIMQKKPLTKKNDSISVLRPITTNSQDRNANLIDNNAIKVQKLKQILDRKTDQGCLRTTSTQDMALRYIQKDKNVSTTESVIPREVFTYSNLNFNFNGSLIDYHNLETILATNCLSTPISISSSNNLIYNGQNETKHCLVDSLYVSENEQDQHVQISDGLDMPFHYSINSKCTDLKDLDIGISSKSGNNSIHSGDSIVCQSTLKDKFKANTIREKYKKELKSAKENKHVKREDLTAKNSILDRTPFGSEIKKQNFTLNSVSNEKLEYYEVPTFRGTRNKKVTIKKFIDKQKMLNPKIGTAKIGKTFNYFRAPLTFKNRKFFESEINEDEDESDNLDTRHFLYSSINESRNSKGSLKFSDNSYVCFFDKQEAIGTSPSSNDKIEACALSSGCSSLMSNSNSSICSSGSKSILKSKVNPRADIELGRAEECDSIDVEQFIYYFEQNDKRRLDESEKIAKMRERQVQFYYSENSNKYKEVGTV